MQMPAENVIPCCELICQNYKLRVNQLFSALKLPLSYHTMASNISNKLFPNKIRFGLK